MYSPSSSFLAPGANGSSPQSWSSPATATPPSSSNLLNNEEARRRVDQDQSITTPVGSPGLHGDFDRQGRSISTPLLEEYSGDDQSRDEDEEVARIFFPSTGEEIATPSSCLALEDADEGDERQHHHQINQATSRHCHVDRQQQQQLSEEAAAASPPLLMLPVQLGTMAAVSLDLETDKTMGRQHCNHQQQQQQEDLNAKKR